MNDAGFVDLMAAAIAESNGTEAEALVMFELHLLDRDDPRLVWELFAPVRTTLLRRLYGMALHQLRQTSEASPSSPPSPIAAPGTASEPYEAVDSPSSAPSTHGVPRHSTVSAFDRRRVLQKSATRTTRGARSAQDVIISIGGRKSHLDYITNHRGTPIGDLTYYGLANAHDELPMVQRYCHALMDSGIPKSDRSSDVVRKFITPEQADRIWLDLVKEVA